MQWKWLAVCEECGFKTRHDTWRPAQDSASKHTTEFQHITGTWQEIPGRKERR